MTTTPITTIELPLPPLLAPLVGVLGIELVQTAVTRPVLVHWSPATWL